MVCIDFLLVRRLLIFIISFFKKGILLNIVNWLQLHIFRAWYALFYAFMVFNIDEQLSQAILVCLALCWILILTFHTFVLFLWIAFWWDFLWSNFVVMDIVSHFKYFYLAFPISQFVYRVSLNFTRVFPHC